MGNYRKPHDGVHAQDYHTGPRPSSYCENGLILDDCNLEGDVCKGGNEFLDSGHLPGSSKASHSSGMEMLQNHTSIMLPCFEGLATTKYMLQVLKLREKKNKITKTAMYSNKPSNTSLDDHNGDDVSHGNVLYLEKRPRESRGYGQPHPASEDDELPKWQSPLSSVQASLFLHDGIFYQTPRRRPPVNVNAPRRLRKLESSKNPLAYARRVNNANRCQKRKAGFHTSSNFATLASYEKLELWDSPKDSAGCEVGNIMKLDNLAQFAVRESAGTTDGIKNCVQIAENINSMVANTLNILHQQGEQTREAHECTLEIDHNLSAGEKILGSFGRFFSTKTWKPVKMRVIKGPQKPSPRGSVLDKKCNSGLLDFAHTFVKSQPVRLHSGLPTEVKLPWQAKVKIEEREQIDGLTDLSNIVSELKKMSLNMGDELSRQTEALDPFQDEVVELSQRLKRANLRGRLLLA
ncbi:hypothetical protein L7F22_027319 [Adiantum nelumboides]|nr:hypothetical protein [Adiantum nelumboides]